MVTKFEMETSCHEYCNGLKRIRTLATNITKTLNAFVARFIRFIMQCIINLTTDITSDLYVLEIMLLIC